MIKRFVLCIAVYALLSNCVYAGDCKIIHKSIKFYEKQAKEDISNVCAFYNLANEYYLKKKYQKALNIYDDIITLYPKEEMAYLEKAHIYYRFNNHDKADREIGRLIKNIPDSVTGNITIALIYQNISDYENALKHIDKAIGFSKEIKPKLYYDKAGILYDMGRYEEAIEYYNKCIKADSKYDSRVYYDLYKCYEALGNTSKTEEYRTKWFYTPDSKMSFSDKIKLKYSDFKRMLKNDNLY